MEKLSKKTLRDLSKARENTQKGKFYTEKESKKILNLPKK